MDGWLADFFTSEGMFVFHPGSVTRSRPKTLLSSAYSGHTPKRHKLQSECWDCEKRRRKSSSSIRLSPRVVNLLVELVTQHNSYVLDPPAVC